MVDVATLETIGEGALDVGFFLAGLVFPPAVPFLAIAKEVVPALLAARPIIQAAVQKGESAFVAVDAASPGLGGRIRALAAFIPGNSSSVMPHLDAVTIAGAGFSVPGWTQAQTQKWLDDAAPHGDPSKENSNVGSG